MKPASEYSFGNPVLLFGSAPTWRDCSWPQEETFQSSRSEKIWLYLMTSHKSFLQKIPKIHTLTDSAGNQLSRISWIISKFGIEMPDICGHVTGFLKIFESLFNANQVTKRSGKSLNTVSFVIFWPSSVPLNSNTTKSGINAEHYVDCINGLADFCNNL